MPHFATSRQLDLLTTIGKEAREAAGDNPHRNKIVTALAKSVGQGGLTVREASEMITALKDLKAQWRTERRTSCQPTKAEPQPGMYRDGEGTIYRVYLGQQSGKMLVKQVVGDKASGYSYEYMGAAAYRLPAGVSPLSLEKAKQWGRMTGTCCVCARRLDNPESVDAGIGPVCAGRMEEGFTK